MTENQNGYPDDNPKTAFGEAKPKLSDTPTIGIREMGRVFTMGAGKYGRFNWREHAVSSSVYYDAAQRHLMAWFDGEDRDPESGLPHLAHVMACVNIIMDAADRGKLNDNRFPPLPVTSHNEADEAEFTRGLREAVTQSLLEQEQNNAWKY